VILFAWCKFKSDPLPSRKMLLRLSISGIFMLVGGTGMIAWAEQYIGSGQAAILIATQPLWFLIIDKQRWGEYFSNKFILAGLALGFTGIYLFLKFDHLHPNHSAMSTIASIVIIGSAIIWVFGSLIIKNSSEKTSAVMSSSVQLLIAGVVCFVIALASGEFTGFNIGHVPGEAWGGLLFLVVMGSLLAYLSFMWLIAHRSPAIVSTHTYVNPVVAVILGCFLIGEKIVFWQIVSLLIILIGILLVNVPGYRRMKVGKDLLEVENEVVVK
jgi:drug/metabolite transporter (DMT)-like permease